MIPRSGADNPLIAELILDYREKHKTNADRIRAMSDEELAEWLRDIVVDSVRMIMFTHESRRIQEWLDWLKQEVE